MRLLGKTKTETLGECCLCESYSCTVLLVTASFEETENDYEEICDVHIELKSTENMLFSTEHSTTTVLSSHYSLCVIHQELK